PPPTPPRYLYPLSLHDALPILDREAILELDHEAARLAAVDQVPVVFRDATRMLGVDEGHFDAFGLDGAALVARDDLFAIDALGADRKSTRLNSSHEWISYAVFC